jgi:hypothetical protein
MRPETRTESNNDEECESSTRMQDSENLGIWRSLVLCTLQGLQGSEPKKNIRQTLYPYS